MQFTQNEYEVLESVGSVTVCLEKDKDTAQDFVATITASEGGSSTATGSETDIQVCFLLTQPLTC